MLDNLQNCVYPNNRLPEQLRDCYQAVLNSLLVDGLILKRCNDAFIPFAARAGTDRSEGLLDFEFFEHASPEGSTNVSTS